MVCNWSFYSVDLACTEIFHLWLFSIALSMLIMKISILLLFGDNLTEILPKYYKEVILKVNILCRWIKRLIIPDECSLCHGPMLMNAHECSWVFMSVQRCSWVLMRAHDCSWELMRAYECSWMLMSAKGCPWVLVSARECSLPRSWVFMAGHEHFLALISTYKQ